MELNTFGALLKFALELEESAVRFYEEAAKTARGGALRRSLAALAESAETNRQRLERVRREQVNEMLLESIEGLSPGDYGLSGGAPAGLPDAEIAAAAARLEAVAERFYRNAAGRLSIPEVVRSFLRLADAHARNGTQVGGSQ